jgi:hypothetical protein
MKRINRITALITALAVMLASLYSFSFLAYADELRYFERGVLTDGTNTAYYVIDKDNKVLYITGDGNNLARTPDYPDAASGPFAGRTDVTRIVIEEDVAKVGDYALSNMTKVDTLEVQSNLLSSSSSMSSKAMIGCTGLRHIQGDSSLLSTDVFLEVVKGAVNIATANWLSLIANGISIVQTGVNGDGSLDNDTIHCMVDDYINNQNKIFLGDLEEAKAEYNERLASPCYSNNAFHHNYSTAVTTQPTCTAQGVETHTCSVCQDSYTTSLPALGHNYSDTVLYQPSCYVEGIMKHSCSRCGSASYEAIPAIGHHSYDLHYDSDEDTYTEICSVCNDENTEFENDISALVAAADLTEEYFSDDYTEASFSAMQTAAERYVPLDYDDTLQYPQSKVDEKATEILTKIDELVPYLNIRLTTDSLTPEIIIDGVSGKVGKYSAVFGTQVTLKAHNKEGYTFKGWYETITKRYISDSEEYTFTLSSNMNIRAVYCASDYSTLTFLNIDGQTKAYYKKSVDSWNSLSDITNLLPEIPYSYGKSGGSWVYDNEEVLSALRSGNDVSVSVAYEEASAPAYEIPVSDGVVPALKLHFAFDSTQNVGSFIMTGDIPQGCNYKEIGIAFYYADSEGFSPNSFRLTINNKMVTSKFASRSEGGMYIVNFKKMKETKSYAARGYVTYEDEEGNLRIVYSDQINIVSFEQV